MSHDQIIAAVANYFGITVTQLLSRDTSQPTVQRRHIAMYLCYHELQASYPQVGKWFDRDHTTVMYGVHRIERSHDPRITQNINQIIEKLQCPVDKRGLMVSVGDGIVLA
jgi:chromosomal replication initiator protein